VRVLFLACALGFMPWNFVIFNGPQYLLVTSLCQFKPVEHGIQICVFLMGFIVEFACLSIILTYP
jgi:hypothetical protein